MAIINKIKIIGLITASTLVLSACNLPGLGAGGTDGEGVAVAGQGTTEALILNHIVAQMVEHYMGVETETIGNLGTSNMVHQAMMSGEADIGSAKYTGTSVTGELGLEATRDPELAQELVVEGFAEEFDIKWYPSYGFPNTYAFMVRGDVARELNLQTISDVAPYADELRAGVDSTWIEREGDGYEGFQEVYFEFGDIYGMSIGLVYDAVAAGEMDIVLGYSTDGRIASYDLVVLEDDQNYFPPYDASPAANYESLEQYPILDDVLLKLEGAISVEMMQHLNFVADDLLMEPATTAQIFLEENNYFEDRAPYLEPVKEGEEIDANSTN